MATLEDRGHLLTEQVNPASAQLDQLSSREIVALFNREDQRCIEAIAAAGADLAAAIDLAAERLGRGGRLFYIGAGTSGRLGVLDAAECPPTFCTPPELVQGILAGGRDALVRSSEGLEDRADDGAQAMADAAIGPLDVVVGITAGGTTPYVRGALAEARQRGAGTVFLACVPADQAPIEVDVDLRLPVGPEVLAGSTRLKAGTVTKLALNILSTGTMVKLGKVYGNRMVDVSVSNTKLEDRALRMLCDLGEMEREQAADLLERSGRRVKTALLMHWGSCDRPTAEAALAAAGGQLRAALEHL